MNKEPKRFGKASQVAKVFWSFFTKKDCLLAVFLLCATSAVASPDRAERADGTRIIPDHFLREWDPVTVFFTTDTGPKAGGPEDQPQHYVTLQPATPGAWQWLGARVLQFRPAEPWQAGRRVRVAAGTHATMLVPLLPVPVATGPSDTATGVVDLDRIALTFPGPVDTDALARLLTIELRPAPGITAAGATLLTAQDFDVTQGERAARGDKQVVVVVLHRPVADGQVAILRLRLSDMPGLDTPGLDIPVFETRLHSAAPFVFTDASCASGFGRSVVGSADGVRNCAPEQNGAASPARGIDLVFTAQPEALDVVRARDVLRISPHVDGLSTVSDATTLHISGAFRPATVYTLSVLPGGLHDTRGRALAAMPDQSFAFAAPPPGLRWDAAQGIVERYGPQMVPLRGQGYAKADLRIHPVDPLSRDFWPFPAAGLVTSDATAPPLPGREPVPWDQPGPISPDDMAQRIGAMGSPSVSTLADLPATPGGLEQKFGLDVAPYLAGIAGARQPGTYLLGLRPVDATQRHWVRVQVTDLSLTAVEEDRRVHFALTSLATARPVAGAVIELQETQQDGSIASLARGTTDSAGDFTWTVPDREHSQRMSALSRVVVTKGADTLVFDPRHGPPAYTQGGWGRGGGNWLGWAAAGNTGSRGDQPRLLCHVFTERPIYRPEEHPMIAGMIRDWQKGALSFASGVGTVIVTGPDNQQWKLPAALDDAGGFHVAFDAKTDATGDYSVVFQPDANRAACGTMTFKKEAYRLPTFEVLLTGKQTVPLDHPFSVDLLARWFAGGLVSDRPVAWTVTQFPYVWSPPGQDGFAFSSDSRFSGDASFRSTPVLTRAVKTDAGGSAQLVLDPTIEPTAQPREYVVEATVTGDDDIQVRSVQHVVALPPFVLGVKLARYIDHAGEITPEIVALDGEGHPLAGLKMTARLIRRGWNAVLQASDFASGAAKYDTQVIDRTIAERQVTSGAAATTLRFEAKESGVYIVELTASDQAGRAQSVRVDSFVAGDTPVTWAQPPAQTMTLTPDKPAYAPGQTATLVVQSPFQTARALVVTEQPEGPFSYQWIDVAHGYGRVQVAIRKTQVPKLAVHVLLMRGRLPGPGPAAGAPFDQSKPVTVASTAWLTVTPVDNQVRVSFEAPASARPAQEVDLTLHLADAAGRPLAGEATVWMVDQAVLSLAKEQRLDPLPDFIVQRPSRMVARDSRNMAFGIIPLSEAPGGAAGGDRGAENISVRRNFTPVPLYLPRVHVGADGTARIHVKLPDTLTVYMLRAKAISGPDRFGAGTGSMKIRLPLIAQPVLPRFVRPGDSFIATVIGRLVEGAGGPGTAIAAVKGVQLSGPAREAFAWDGGHPARLGFGVTVPRDAAGEATLRFTLNRRSDGAGDAAELTLPIRPDRPVLHERATATMAAHASQTIPALADTARPGTYQRSVVVAADPLLVRIVAGLHYLLEYPFGCTEQRMALAGSELALKPYLPILNAAGAGGHISADVASTLAEIAGNTDADGLVAYWPHVPGSVLLTAWALDFAVQAGQAGYPVDHAMRGRLQHVLEQALRSDYPHLFAREQVRERAAALWALAEAGDLQPAYASELARRAPMLASESLAEVIVALDKLPAADHAVLPGLEDEMWQRVQTRLRDGQTVYGGLTDSPADPLILPSEARGLADVTRAVAIVTPHEPRLGLLRDGLLRIADADGWGSTNATASALRALAASWQRPGADIPVSFALPGQPVPQAGTISADTPLLQAATRTPGPITVGTGGGDSALSLLTDTTYVPAGLGSTAKASAHGFVVSRQLFLVPATGPMRRLEPGADGAIHLAVGDVVEEADEVVNPEARTNVALRLPLPAGMEPLNPNLATSPANAAPSAAPSQAPDYASYGDDEVLAVFQTLSPGTLTLRTRMRAMVSGGFTQPPAQIETMYQEGVNGSSDGVRVVIGP